MASEYTPNYNLDLYASEDKPNLRDQYNAAMGKIDTQLKANADGVTNVSASVVAATTAANEAKQIAQDAEAAAENAAPINHASTEAIYGLGGALKYGHVSLASQITNPTIAEDGIAASPKAVYQFVDNGYAPKNHASIASTYGRGSTTQFGHVQVSDNASDVSSAENGKAMSPIGVNNKITNQVLEVAAPHKIFNHSSFNKSATGYSVQGYLDVNANHLTQQVTVNIQITGLNVSSLSSFATVNLGNIPTEWRPGYSHNSFIGFTADGEYFTLVIDTSGNILIGLSTGTYSYSTCGTCYVYTVGD